MFLLLVLIVLSFFLFGKIKNNYKLNKSLNKTFLRTIIFFCFCSLFLSIKSFRNENLPFVITKSFYDLNRDPYINNNQVFESHTGPFSNSSEINLEKEETHVIIVGESISRLHMSLYGYNRNTNPLLKKINGELLVYKNVISPHAYTTGSLRKALT